MAFVLHLPFAVAHEPVVALDLSVVPAVAVVDAGAIAAGIGDEAAAVVAAAAFAAAARTPVYCRGLKDRYRHELPQCQQ